MIIINADDLGRSRLETDAALACYERGRITSATAMVFMKDSERAAHLALERGIDIGLHLNLSQQFTGKVPSGRLAERHERVAHCLGADKYAALLYHPMLRSDLKYVYQAQVDAFASLYGRRPSHIDGHHHLHLSTNMVLGGIVADGDKIRRSFHFWPGEKSIANRMYRRAVDRLLIRRYKVTDYFFALSQCMRQPRLERVMDVARESSVEIMTHPVVADEFAFLMSDAFNSSLGTLEMGTYSAI